MSEEVATPVDTTTITLNDKLPETAPPAPRDGDFVTHCEHVSERQNFWYWCENTTFKQGDVSGPIHWALLCAECELLVKADSNAQVLKGLAVYQSQPTPTLVAPNFESPVTASA